MSTENPPPFYFVSKLVEATVRIKEPSMFLVGDFNYQILELDVLRLSRQTSLKLKKK